MPPASAPSALRYVVTAPPWVSAAEGPDREGGTPSSERGGHPVDGLLEHLGARGEVEADEPAAGLPEDGAGLERDPSPFEEPVVGLRARPDGPTVEPRQVRGLGRVPADR